MQIAYDLLHILKNGKFHSGTQLAQQLRVSRSCIWKGVDFLRKHALPIQAVQGKGYRWYEPMELLDKNLITSNLNETAKKAISVVDIVNLIPSTNDYLLQREHCLQHGAVCIAEGQSAGKGRMGRQWHSPFAANLYLSLYWRFGVSLQALSGLSLVVGIAVIDALKESALLPQGVGIKWPNDIYYHNAKLGGILVETHRNQGIVIGIGINISMPTAEVDGREITDLRRIMHHVPSRNWVASQCLNFLVTALKQFEHSGLSSFSSQWLQYDLLNGKQVELTTLESPEIGTARGINERGELLIQFGKTLKAIRSGEIKLHFHSEMVQND